MDIDRAEVGVTDAMVSAFAIGAQMGDPMEPGATAILEKARANTIKRIRAGLEASIALLPQSGKMRESEPVAWVEQKALDDVGRQGRSEMTTLWARGYVPEHTALYLADTPKPTHRRKSDGTEWVLERTAVMETMKWLRVDRRVAAVAGDVVEWDVTHVPINGRSVHVLTPVSGGQAICVPESEVSEKFEEMK